MIAAFRFEAQHYWRNVKAEKRRGDRDAVPFDVDEHAEGEDLLARMFDAGPHEELVARDWLAQLQGEVRAFWALLLEGVSFTQASERLGLSYRECQVLYRAGLEQLGRFRTLQAGGMVCQLRAPAIAALRAGTADELTAERARAHLACCLPCALVHEKNASALKRGIFHVLPLPAVVRALGRVREIVGDRAVEATAGGATGVGGAFLLSNGTTTALLCVGALASGACAVGIAPFPSLAHAHHAHHQAPRLASIATPSGSSAAATLAPATLSNTFAAVSPAPRSSGPVKQPRARTTEFGAPPRTRPKSSGSTAPTSAQAAEFSPENAGTTSTASSSSPTASTASTRPSSRSTSSSTSSTTRSASSPTPAASSEFGGP